ncbi:MAG: MFS transporter [Chloroflexi bacterium]|nr:MAG: MFS transporter [Chloroflexota bacterium]
MAALFKNKVYLVVVVAHFVIDVFNSSGPVLVTFLSVPMKMSAAQIGLAVGGYQFFAALTQPLFGWLADRVGSRWLGPGSVTWTIGFLVLSLVAADRTGNFWLFLAMFVLASVGSSAFHPLGTKHAADEVAHIAATGTAVFFLFGQTGLATGPILTGIILDISGTAGLYLLALMAVPYLIFMAIALRGVRPDAHAHHTSASAATAKKIIRWGAISVLALLMGLRSWAFLGTVTFLPKLFQEMGWEATGYGFITGTFWMASAITGVLAGNLADRYGRRQVVFATLLIGSIPLYFLPLTDGWMAFPLAIIAGGLLGASHSILVVISQAILPGKKAFTSGVTLGYLFGTGALAAWLIGSMADTWGLAPIIQAGTLAGVAAALLAFALPSTRQPTQTSAEQPEAVPVKL